MSGYILGLDPTQVWDDSAGEVPEFKVGQLGADDDGKIYQFVRAKGALTVGDVVAIDEVGDADAVETTVSAPGTGQGLALGVALAILADNDWGWAQRYGVCASINVVDAAAVHTELNTTSSGGRLDDDATVGSEIAEGITITASASSNRATGILHWPYIGRTLVADAT